MEELANWDPLKIEEELSEEIKSAKIKREIKNILKSYTGWYDPLAELIQNALDAVDERNKRKEKNYIPKIWIEINLKENSISVTDNGIGFDQARFKNFLKPNVSFKGGNTRGNKGVGATYLAYGFNFLQICTKTDSFNCCGDLKEGRKWVEDEKGIESRATLQISTPLHQIFNSIDKGSSFTLKFLGDSIYPADLNWICADNAEQWEKILRINTPLGGIYFNDQPKTICSIKIINEDGKESEKEINNCVYVFPHEVVGASLNLKEIIEMQTKLLSKSKDPGILPSNFYNLNAVYAKWTDEDILNGRMINPKLTPLQKTLLKQYKVQVYGFFCYSTKIWDEFNDNVLKLRKKARILKGGLQLATNGMPQGRLLTIPLTSNIGYQQQCHIIIHFDSADPDLGRKGFQPELQELAESISISVVGVLKTKRNHLKKDTGAPPNILEDSKVDEWIRSQEQYEKENCLKINNSEFFLPMKEIAITSKPRCEQDVIALFNQLIAGGVIRGIKIMATSGSEKYDGIYRVFLKKPVENHIFNKEKNPLGIPKETLPEEFTSKSYILEYKHNFDALIREIENEEKTERNINLIVVWDMGTEWEKRYKINPLLHLSNLHNRTFHGATHDVRNALTGDHVFYAISLSELIDYINDVDGIQEKQEKIYIQEE